MSNSQIQQSRLYNESSPYLLQHADNPVDWWPWCDEAFETARAEDKPVFLSIGYSACHWCHVMAHECFSDEEVAAALNQDFISIKVDREARPDVDHVYMEALQRMTGSGGWPASLFLTTDKKPFYGGTYFPKHPQRGMPGFLQILASVSAAWEEERASLLDMGNRVTALLSSDEPEEAISPDAYAKLADRGAAALLRQFDSQFGGFGPAPKFPMPHILLFLMDYARDRDEPKAMAAVEKTLEQMYRGGLFDHIGGGFCRYSTDRRFLIPHFEKMLYDNALLLMAYTAAYSHTGNEFYKQVAMSTANYTLREMRHEGGGFFSAQDADSEGEEGRFYALIPEEVEDVLGPEQGRSFCARYGITKGGNFEGKSVPNLLDAPLSGPSFGEEKAKLYRYRRSRTHLNLDDKVLTGWNSLLIEALSEAGRAFQNERYLCAAKQASANIKANLREGEGLLVGGRDGRRMGPGFLDDYAFYGMAQLALYRATLEKEYLDEALWACNRAIEDFYDASSGGFFLAGKGNEALISAPKPAYDGAIPSGNGAMSLLLLRLSLLLEDQGLSEIAERHRAFLAGIAASSPSSHTVFLRALLQEQSPPAKVVCVLSPGASVHPNDFPTKALVRVLHAPEGAYQLLNEKTTYYVCRGNVCLPPSNTAPSPS